MNETPTIEQQVSELRAAGWKKSGIPHVWKSPTGKLFLGPHGAWKQMAGYGDQGTHAEVTVRTVTERP